MKGSARLCLRPRGERRRRGSLHVSRALARSLLLSRLLSRSHGLPGMIHAVGACDNDSSCVAVAVTCRSSCTHVRQIRWPIFRSASALHDGDEETY
jgi:hypothetical protein